MGAEQSDVELIKAFQAGNRQSFEELIRRYSAKAFCLASRLTGSQEDAEEVLQDVFTTVYYKIAGFEGKSSFSSWLYRVTVNASLMNIRKRKQDRTVAIGDLATSPQTAEKLHSTEQDGGDHYTFRREVSAALEQAIRDLPDDYRPVFVLRDVDGLTSTEVSHLLELSVPAVKSRLHRSRLMVREQLRPVYADYQPDKQVSNL